MTSGLLVTRDSPAFGYLSRPRAPAAVRRNHTQSVNRWHDGAKLPSIEVGPHGDTATRFELLAKRLLLGDTSAAYAALNAHIERQRWRGARKRFDFGGRCRHGSVLFVLRLKPRGVRGLYSDVAAWARPFPRGYDAGFRNRVLCCRVAQAFS